MATLNRGRGPDAGEPDPDSGARNPGADLDRADVDPRRSPDALARDGLAHDSLGHDGLARDLAAEPALDVVADQALDHALVRRAQAGEESAFEALVRRHQQRAWRVARNLVASDEDAQDLAQEAFVRVFRSLASFDFQHPFTTWLYRIVTNLSIDHLRRRRPTASTTRADEDESDLDVVDTRVSGPADRLESLELADEVKATLAGLAPHFQSVLVLREVEGLPCNEIAKIVGATHVTVRWRLHRGRKLFQEEWERRARLREAGGDPAAVRREANARASDHVDHHQQGHDPEGQA